MNIVNAVLDLMGAFATVYFFVMALWLAGKEEWPRATFYMAFCGVCLIGITKR